MRQTASVDHREKRRAARVRQRGGDRDTDRREKRQIWGERGRWRKEEENGGEEDQGSIAK